MPEVAGQERNGREGERAESEGTEIVSEFDEERVMKMRMLR